MHVATYREQQRKCGFDTLGVEQMRLAAIGDEHAGRGEERYNLLVDTIKRIAALDSPAPADTVTVLNDNGTVHEVCMKAAIARDRDILADIAKYKSHRPCHSCGTHSCPPGSDDFCFASTTEPILNTRGASAITQAALDAWITEHNLDPYTLYLDDSSPVLDHKHSGPCYDSRGFLLSHITDPVEFMRAARQYNL
jgi:hypothetical protein